ncbi:hypothetical protein [Telluribacter humicola]|uniref:hypothetical protein n=1 Tax=Telluribacter humicola TaxID=1720261 RepID=UPI001A978629|nr:hypothetical protein [Telluribacter humicola]
MMTSINQSYSDTMSLLAREQVQAYLVRSQDLYIFGSEAACQRIMQFYRGRPDGVCLSYAIDPWYQHYVTLPNFQ